MRAVARVAASRKRPLYTAALGTRAMGLAHAVVPSGGIKSQRDLLAAMLSEWIDKGTVRRGIQLLELSGHQLDAPLLERGMRECDKKDAQKEVALLFREYCDVVDGPVPLELYHLAMRAAIAQNQVATFTRVTSAFLSSYRDKSRGTMARFKREVDSHWWQPVMEQCQRHEQGPKCLSSLVSEMSSAGLPIPKALATQVAQLTPQLTEEGQDEKEEEKEEGQAHSKIKSSGPPSPSPPSSSRAVAALGLVETRLLEQSSLNDVDSLIATFHRLSPTQLAALSEHTYTAVWRAFKRAQRAEDGLSLLRRLEAAVEGPTQSTTTPASGRGGAKKAEKTKNAERAENAKKAVEGKAEKAGEAKKAGEEKTERAGEEKAEGEEYLLLPGAAYDGVLALLCDAGRRDEATRLFQHMLDKGVALRGEGPSSLLSLLGSMNLHNEALALLHTLTHEWGYTPSLDAYNAVIWACVRKRRVDDAMKVYESLVARGLVGNRRTMNGCLSGLASEQRWEDMRHLYARIRTHKMHLDVMSYQLMLGACAKLRDAPEALRLMREMRDLRFLPSAPCYSGAISACGSCHMKDEALTLFHEARRLKVLDNANGLQRQVLYGAVLRACAEEGDTTTVMTLLHDMRQGGVALNRFLYTSALHACSVARDSDLALQLLQDMEDSGTTPDLPPLTAALMAHSRADRPERVLPLLDHMSSLGLPFSDVSLRLGLSAAHTLGRHAQAADFCLQGLARGKVIPPDLVHLAVVSCHDHLTPQEGVALMDAALRAGVRVRLDSVKLAVAMAERAGDRASRSRLAALASCLTEGWTSNMTPMTPVPGPKKRGGVAPYDKPRNGSGSALDGSGRSRGQNYKPKAPK